MNGIYNYIYATNRVPAVYDDRAILWFRFMVYVMQFPIINILYFYVNSLQSTYSVPNMTVFLVP